MNNKAEPLSQEEKIEVLIKIKQLILSGKEKIMCNAFQAICSTGSLKECIPEIWDEKPDGDWWPSKDKESRISAIDRTIERIKDKDIKQAMRSEMVRHGNKEGNSFLVTQMKYDGQIE